MAAVGLSFCFAGCTPSGGNAACGITALAGATMLLDQFSIPRQTLADPPLRVPPNIPVRVAAGPALRATASLTDEGWTVSVEGVPGAMTPGFAVLVVSADGNPRGVMLYAGPPLSGAPIIGSVIVGSSRVPLLGLQADIGGLEDPSCPFFPDSLRGP